MTLHPAPLVRLDWAAPSTFSQLCARLQDAHQLTPSLAGSILRDLIGQLDNDTLRAVRIELATPTALTMLPAHVRYLGDVSELAHHLAPCTGSFQALQDHLCARTARGEFITLHAPSTRAIDAFASGQSSQLLIDQTFCYSNAESARQTVGGIVLSQSSTQLTVSSHT